MKPKVEFIAHVDLPGLFEVFVVPADGGTRFQFYPYPPLKDRFPEYLAKRFASLGEPAEAVYQQDVGCFDAYFRGLLIRDPEEALKRLTAGR